MSRTEVQLKARSTIIDTREGHALTFGFKLGPVSIFVIANLPEYIEKGESALVYIKIDLRVGEDWQYSTESSSKKG